MRRSISLLSAVFGCAAPFALPAQPQDPARVDFAKQIRPIFEARCYECHGPDEQEGDLRLDRRSAVFHDGGVEKWVVVPGNPDKSELYARITLPYEDPDVMPNEGELLTKEQIALIRAWIEQGAEWPEGPAPAAEPAEAAAQPIAVPELTEAELAVREAAMEALRGRGAHALAVAADTTAVDVNWSLAGAEVKDADLALLEGLEKSLVWLNLSRTAVTDAGVARLAKLGQLRRLDLSRTAVTDEGLRHLAGLEQLEHLNLYGTRVSDAGLQHLRGLDKLAKLYLWQTAVTEAGAKRLQEALPALEIDLGGYAADILEVARARAPVNDTCPLTEKPVKPAYVVVHEGRTIGFCCEKCLAKFQKNPAEFADKVVEAKKEPDEKPAEEPKTEPKTEPKKKSGP